MTSLRQRFNKNNIIVITPFFLFVLLSLVLQFDSVVSSKGMWSIDQFSDPYIEYYQNIVISKIQIVACVVDLVILVLILAKLKKYQEPSLSNLLALFLVLSIFLIWFELWYGSTFYYGEVRDKQGLPLTLNNFGAIGSIIFTFVFFMQFKGINKLRVPYKIFIVCVVILCHFIAFKLLETPWNFVSS